MIHAPGSPFIGVMQARLSNLLASSLANASPSETTMLLVLALSLLLLRRQTHEEETNAALTDLTREFIDTHAS